MPSSRLPTQNKLNGNLVDFCLILFGHFSLIVFCMYIIASDFVGCVRVFSWVLFLFWCVRGFCLFVCLFALSSVGRKSLRGVEGGKIVIRIHCMNKYFQLRKKRPRGHLEFISLPEKQLAKKCF